MPAITPELLKHIRRIQIHTTHLVNDIFAGAYHSIFKGRGVEFEDVRLYMPGDEIRSIDWNVSARFNDIFVKNYREERELTVMLIVDVSASSRFGSTPRSKNELIAEIGAILAFSAIKNNDKVGLILFSTKVEKYIPPKKGVRHVLRVIRELLAFEPKEKGTNLAEALTFFGKIQKRRAICFLISDFLCSNYSTEMKLTSKRHDLISIGITDPSEIEFPNIGLAALSDLESQHTQLVDTSNPLLQEQFKNRSEKRLKDLKHLMNQIGAGYIPIKTNQPYHEALRKFFILRKRKQG